MKIYFEKLAMAVNVFTPIVILLFVYSAYLYIPPNEKRDEGSVEMEQVIVKKKQLPVFKSSVEIENREKHRMRIETKPAIPSCFTSSKFLYNQ